ncbi:unnamed protein product [Rhodiola kirilowii]
MKPTRALGYTKRRPRNGTIGRSFVVNLGKETRSCSLTLGSNYSRGKLRSRWSGPFIVHKPHEDGHVELLNNDGTTFTTNGQRLKHYREGVRDEKNVTYHLTDP